MELLDEESLQESLQKLAGTVSVTCQLPTKMRVAWLAPYPTEQLQPELKILRSSKAHPAGWIVNLTKALARRNDVDLRVITASSGIAENQTVIKDGITFHVIRYTFPFSVRGFPEYLRLDVLTRYAYLRREVGRILSKLDADVIHVHGTEYGYGLAALETNIPTIVSIQGVVHILAQVSPSSFFTRQARIELDVIRKAKYFGTRTAWATGIVRDLNNRATIYDLPEAVDPLFFRRAAEQSSLNILMVGTVLQRKGIEDALRAMSIVLPACPSAKLLVIGDGEPNYIEQLKKLARDAEIEGHVEWVGRKTAAEIASLHAMSAVLIHPTHIDNSPNAVAEAMASGLPVIASAVGGISSMIENGITGLLIQPRNHRQLAEALIWLLQNEPERKQLAGRAKEVAAERHAPFGVAEKTVEVYKDILGKERRGETWNLPTPL